MVTNSLPVNKNSYDFETIGDRLREERDRLKKNQIDFANLGQRSKKTLIDYEKGRTEPPLSFLSAVAAIGVDVQYVVTGKRSDTIGADGLLNWQRELLLNLQQCSESERQAIITLAQSLANANQSIKGEHHD